AELGEAFRSEDGDKGVAGQNAHQYKYHDGDTDDGERSQHQTTQDVAEHLKAVDHPPGTSTQAAFALPTCAVAPSMLACSAVCADPADGPITPCRATWYPCARRHRCRNSPWDCDP